jgi:hypothetical protein
VPSTESLSSYLPKGTVIVIDQVDCDLSSINVGVVSQIILQN